MLWPSGVVVFLQETIWLKALSTIYFILWSCFWDFSLFSSSTFVSFCFLFHWGRGVGERVVVLFLIFVILVFRRNKSLHVCKCVLIKMPYICPLWTPMQFLFQYLTAGITIISVEYHTHISEGKIVQLRINGWK